MTKIKSIYESFIKNISYIVKVKNFKDNWSQWLVLLIPILMGIPNIQKIIFSNGFFAFGSFVLLFCVWIHSLNKTVNNSELKNDLDKVTLEKDDLIDKLEAIPERITKSIFNYFKFGYSERITIYRFDEEYFVPVGRYALNQDFKKNSRTRQRYPKNEGYIGLAWKNGYHYVQDLPDPNKSRKSYINIVTKDTNIKRETLESIHMKSRSYFCRNLLMNDEPVAVIVIESTEPKLPVSNEEIEKLLDSSIGQLLTTTIKDNLN
jgi:hypothetical protein